MIRFMVRFPDETHARLKVLAARDRRSMHEQLVWLVERALDQEGIRDVTALPPEAGAAALPTRRENPT